MVESIADDHRHTLWQQLPGVLPRHLSCTPAQSSAWWLHAITVCVFALLQVIERVAAALPQPAPSAAVFVGGLPTADDEKRLRR